MGGYAGFSIAQLQEHLVGIDLFSFREGFAGPADQPDSAICYLCDADVEKVCSVLREVPQSEELTLSSVWKGILMLKILKMRPDEQLMIVETCDWGRWENTQFATLRELDVELRSAGVKALPVPSNAKIFRP